MPSKLEQFFNQDLKVSSYHSDDSSITITVKNKEKITWDLTLPLHENLKNNLNQYIEIAEKRASITAAKHIDISKELLKKSLDILPPQTLYGLIESALLKVLPRGSFNNHVSYLYCLFKLTQWQIQFSHEIAKEQDKKDIFDLKEALKNKNQQIDDLNHKIQNQSELTKAQIKEYQHKIHELKENHEKEINILEDRLSKAHLKIEELQKETALWKKWFHQLLEKLMKLIKNIMKNFSHKQQEKIKQVDLSDHEAQTILEKVDEIDHQLGKSNYEFRLLKPKTKIVEIAEPKSKKSTNPTSDEKSVPQQTLQQP